LYVKLLYLTSAC